MSHKFTIRTGQTLVGTCKPTQLMSPVLNITNENCDDATMGYYDTVNHPTIRLSFRRVLRCPIVELHSYTSFLPSGRRSSNWPFQLLTGQWRIRTQEEEISSTALLLPFLCVQQFTPHEDSFSAHVTLGRTSSILNSYLAVTGTYHRLNLHVVAH